MAKAVLGIGWLLRGGGWSRETTQATCPLPTDFPPHSSWKEGSPRTGLRDLTVPLTVCSRQAGSPEDYVLQGALFHGGLLYSTWHRVLANGGLSHVASSWSPFFPGKPVLHTLWGCAVLHPATHEPERSSHVPLCALTWILLEVMGKPNRKGSQCSDSKSQTQPLQNCPRHCPTFAGSSWTVPPNSFPNWPFTLCKQLFITPVIHLTLVSWILRSYHLFTNIPQLTSIFSHYS